MKETKYQFESIPLNLNQGIIRVSYDLMPENLINQIVAVWSSHKEVLAITVEWKEEREAILKACPVTDAAVFICDHFHIDTWDNRIDNSNHKREQTAAVDILIAALEGGSNYWINKRKFVTNQQDGVLKYDEGLEAFKNGLAHIVIDEDEGATYELSRDKFIHHINHYVETSSFLTLEELHEGHDADDADTILQTALFGDVIYC